jgi:hypothetical protein
MSYIEQVARDALQAAHGDLVRARRSLLPVAGVLALIHLLTVYPYLEASREIAGVEASMAANADLLARLKPEMDQLQQASESAGTRLNQLLDGVTAEMVGRFADLRILVARATADEPADLAPPDVVPPDSSAFAPMQQMPMQAQVPIPQQMQMPQANLPPSPIQAPLPDFPPMQQMGVPPMQATTPNAPGYPGPYPPLGSAGPYVDSPELQDILDELAAGEPAWERLIDYARRDIVEAAYARAEQEWRQRIRPDYLTALQASMESARRVAEQAPPSAAQTATDLRAAADQMSEQRAVLEAIEIRHDSVVDEALGTDWWRTVEGKGAYADAVAQSVAEQMHAIMQTAQAPSEAIREALALQEQLRDALVRQQDELAKQFDEQRKQLASLSGTTGVVPVDLASFIGLFPLVVGLVLGLMLWRVGQARHQGALAAADLSRAAPDDRDTRLWLSRRMLGGGASGASLVTIALAIGALLWIALAAWQIAISPGDPPLPPWTSGALAALAVLFAAGWDLAAIRGLVSQARA